MTHFVIPAVEKTAYYDNAKQRARQVIELTQQVINQALAQGYRLEPVSAQQRRAYGMIAKQAKWCLTLPDGTFYFAESVFMIGKRLTEGVSKNLPTPDQVQ